MTRILILLLCLLSPLATAQLSLFSQYADAFELANRSDGLRFSSVASLHWAREFIERKGELDPRLSILRQYIAAREFAGAADGLRLAPEEADQWAKSFLLKRGQLDPQRQIAPQLQEFLATVLFAEGEEQSLAVQWYRDFLQGARPFVFFRPLLDVHEDIYRFARENPVLPLDDIAARELANQFVADRYHFSPEIPLFGQFVDAFEFANSLQGLQLPEQEARQWAKGFVTNKGTLHPEDNLVIQFAQLRRFAEASGGLRLDPEQARSWAIAFLEQKARFGERQSLFAQFREAYILAYTDDVLDILRPTREIIEETEEENEDLGEEPATPERLDTPEAPPVPQARFLADEADKWARELLEKRSQATLQRNLLRQYHEAENFAYSSQGLRLDLGEAQNWAREFIERVLPD